MICVSIPLEMVAHTNKIGKFGFLPLRLHFYVLKGNN